MSEGKSRTTNCIVYGCLTMVIIFIIMGVAGILGARWGYKKLVNSYTSPAAAQLPPVTYSDAELQSLTNRLESFRVSANALTNEVALSLSAQDINMMIQNNEELKHLRDRFHIEIAQNTVSSTLSLPLDNFGLDALKGRFLNGKAGLKVGVTNGVVSVFLDSLEINGKPVSPAFMTQLKSENLAKDVAQDAEVKKILERVESLTVENGNVVLKLKAAPPEQTAPAATTNAAPGVI